MSASSGRPGPDPGTCGRPVIYDRAVWERLYDQGWSDSRIARAYECDHTTVLNWRRRTGRPPIPSKWNRCRPRPAVGSAPV